MSLPAVSRHAGPPNPASGSSAGRRGEGPLDAGSLREPLLGANGCALLLIGRTGCDIVRLATEIGE